MRTRLLTTLSGCHLNHLYSLLILSSPSGINWINQVVLFSSFTESILFIISFSLKTDSYCLQAGSFQTIMLTLMVKCLTASIPFLLSYRLDSILIVLLPRFHSYHPSVLPSSDWENHQSRVPTLTNSLELN